MDFSLPPETDVSRPLAVNVPQKTIFFAVCVMPMKPPQPAMRGPNLDTLILPEASTCARPSSSRRRRQDLRDLRRTAARGHIVGRQRDFPAVNAGCL